MVQNINFMSKKPVVEKIASATKKEMSGYLPSSELIKFKAPTPVELQLRGLSDAEYKAYLEARNVQNSPILKDAQSKLAEESYKISHGIPLN